MHKSLGVRDPAASFTLTTGVDDRTLRVEIEGWVDADTTVAQADRSGQTVADQPATELPDIRSFIWTACAV